MNTEHARTHIRKMFLDFNEKAERTIYSHYTCATGIFYVITIILHTSFYFRMVNQTYRDSTTYRYFENRDF